MISKEDNGPYNIYAEVEITIEFFDLDPMKIVWHGNYINYFEPARRALMEKIGYSYDEIEKSGYSYPVVEVHAKYISPLRLGDRARIRAVLIEYENRLLIRFEIRNAQTGVLTTKGSSTQMAYDIKNSESCFVCPPILVKKVEAFIERETP
jgi:acyl-CoA thioester hydrolase